MKIETLDYEDLTENEKGMAPDNGSGKDVATYLRIIYEPDDIWLESDAMEPEDTTFHRDLSWIEPALKRAYDQGVKDGYSKT